MKCLIGLSSYRNMTEKLPSPKKPTVMYAVQRKKDGQWSRGGSGSPRWGKYPKTWGLGPFKNHLLMYRVDGYNFSIAKAKEQETKSIYYLYGDVRPSSYTKHKLLHNTCFPYWDCEVVQFDANSMEITARFSAPEWVWDNCYKPNYEKLKGRGSSGTRYFDELMEYCKVFDKDF
jgi:hypothetical protein